MRGLLSYDMDVASPEKLEYDRPADVIFYYGNHWGH